VADDARKWLTEEAGFTQIEADDFLSRFPSKAEVFQRGFLRQGDYSKKMNEYQAEKARLEQEWKAKDDQINRDMAEWAELKASGDQNEEHLRQQVEQTRLEKAQIEVAFRNLAERHGEDITKILAGEKPPEKKEPPVPAPVDLSPLQQQIGGWATYQLSLMGALPGITAEHYTLTGKHLDTQAFVAGILNDLNNKKLDNLDPRKRWEAEYGIPEKRAAQQKAQYDAELKSAEDRGYERARSEAALPVQHAPGHSAPVFTKITPEGKAPESKFHRPQAGASTRQFAQALASGKYRPAAPPPPASAGGKPAA